MRILLLLMLSVLTAICVADSSESNEIDEALFIKRRDANSFVRQAKRHSPWESSRDRFKTLRERNRERCEEYRPCDRLARQVGLKRAIGKFFRSGRQRFSGYRRLRAGRNRRLRKNNRNRRRRF
ncbi:matrix Gla protein-like [Callorhinchus milii]|nr:matrix Gla protein-like [Callorhinchus milii]|eukprot:gi/632982200/ref/XP_007908006.1/ PREDICTED: matrix Gla protein-like [Callorhinchus milii]